MDFGNILSRSWNIVWNNKFLIVLGFLAAFGAGGGGGSNGVNFRFGGDEMNLPPQAVDDVGRFIRNYGAILIGLACVIFVLFIILWLLRLTAQGGLISAVSQIDAGEKVTFREAFSAGTGNLVRLAGVNLLLYGPFTLFGFIAGAVFLATIGGAILSGTPGPGSDLESVFGGAAIILLCIACLTCLIVPLWVLVTAIYPFAQRGAVLQDLGVIDSVRHGWQTVRENLANIILLAILFLVFGLIFGIVAAIVLIPLALLSIGPAILDVIANDSVRALDILLIATGGVCVGLVGAAVNSIMIAYRSTVVTLAYKEFTQKSAA